MKRDLKSKQAHFPGKSLLCAAAIGSSAAFALWATPAGNLDALAELETGIDSMHVSIIIGDEDRKREAEFAAANGLPLEVVRNATEATGWLICEHSPTVNSGMVTAQVTGARHVISTAAHFIMNTDTCQRYDWQGCVFRTLHSPAKKYHVVTESIRTGECNPGVTGRYTDWAVMRLESPVENVEPLLLPPPRTNPDPDLITISAMSANFESGAIASAILEVCRVRLNKGVQLATDCDTGPGTSGSAQLNLGTLGLLAALKKKEIAAINVATVVDDDGNVVEGDDFHHDRYNISIPVKGPFRQALVEAMAEPIAASKTR